MNFPVNEAGVIDWERVRRSWHRMADPDSPFRPHECDVSQCLFCVHLRDRLARERAVENLRYGRPACDAYPKGIPMEIWYNVHDHRTAYEGDRGVRFTAKPE